MLQRVPYGIEEKKTNYAAEESDKHYFSQVVKINLKSDAKVCSFDRVWQEWHLSL